MPSPAQISARTFFVKMRKPFSESLTLYLFCSILLDPSPSHQHREHKMAGKVRMTERKVSASWSHAVIVSVTGLGGETLVARGKHMHSKQAEIKFKCIYICNLVLPSCHLTPPTHVILSFRIFTEKAQKNDVFAKVSA